MIRSANFGMKLLPCIIILFYYTNLFGQRDSTHIAKTTTGIGDTASVTDSSAIKLPPKPYLVNFIDSNKKKQFRTYNRSKEKINFSDYRYSGDILKNLPFAFINDLGSLGSPNEPILYGFGYGDFSLSYQNSNLRS